MDLLGNTVAVLAQGLQSAGTHVSTFDGRALSSGLYIAELRTPTSVAHVRMTLAK